MRRTWATIAALAMLSCGATLKDQRTDAGLYGAQLLACVEFSETREESRACRESVMRRYGRSVPDASAPTASAPDASARDTGAPAASPVKPASSVYNGGALLGQLRAVDAGADAGGDTTQDASADAGELDGGAQ